MWPNSLSVLPFQPADTNRETCSQTAQSICTRRFAARKVHFTQYYDVSKMILQEPYL